MCYAPPLVYSKSTYLIFLGGAFMFSHRDSLIIHCDGSRGIGNGSAGSAKQKALRRAIGKAGGGLQIKAFGKWL